MWKPWRSTGGVVKQSVSAIFSQVYGRKTRPPHPSYTLRLGAIVPATSLHSRPSSSSPGADSNSGDSNRNDISFEETKKLMRLVSVEALKRKLGMEAKEVMGYSELLLTCESMGVARSLEEAAAFARVLDEAGVVHVFRDKVYLHPHKVVDLVTRAVPYALTSEDDPTRDELKLLKKKNEEIDMLAWKQVRRILWSGLGFASAHIVLFFRLTYWEFSWDVMGPIAYFTTSTGIVIGYAYFLFTSRAPSYQGLMVRLFLSRQRKLFKKHNFDGERFKELQKKVQNTYRCHGFY